MGYMQHHVKHRLDLPMNQEQQANRAYNMALAALAYTRKPIPDRRWFIAQWLLAHDGVNKKVVNFFDPD